MAWGIGLLGLLGLAGCNTLAPAPAKGPNLPPAAAQWIGTGPEADAPSPAPAMAPASAAPLNSPMPPESPPRAWRLNDPLLDELLLQADRHNTRALSAEAAWQQARALRLEAAAGWWPALQASATAQRNRSGSAAAQNTLSASVDATWAPDLFGRQRDAVNATEAREAAAEAQWAGTQALVASELTLSYLALRSSQQRLALAQANLASQQETLQITRWRVQAGLLTALQAQQALAAAEQTAALLPAWQNSIELQSHAIALLTGQAPVQWMNALARAAPLAELAADPALSPPALTLARLPAWQAAQQQVQAAAADLAQAQAAQSPSLALSGSLGASALSLGGLGSAAAVLRAVAARWAVPVFDGGALQARVQAQQALLVQAQQARQGVSLAALQAVEDARSGLQANRLRQQSLQAASDAAGLADALARQRFAAGLVDFPSVLDTQRARLAAQDSLASVDASLRAGQVELATALGLLWRGAAPAPASAPTPADPAAPARVDAALPRPALP